MLTLDQYFQTIKTPGYSTPATSLFNVSISDTGQLWRLGLTNGYLTVADMVDLITETVCFCLTEESLLNLAQGTASPKTLFLTGKIHIKGDVHAGMKLSNQLEQLFRLHPATETMDRVIDEETICIETTDGVQVSAELGYLDDSDSNRILVLFPPHPLLGGDTNNNVVTAIAHEAITNGWVAARVAYRGTGGNTIPDQDMETYWERLEHDRNYSSVVSDSETLLQQLANEFPVNMTYAAVGYSFGSYIGLQTANRIPFTRFIAVAPPLIAYNFNSLALRSQRFSIFVADNDEFCPVAMAERTAGLSGGLLHSTGAGDHFYRGTETQLAKSICEQLEEHHEEQYQYQS